MEEIHSERVWNIECFYLSIHHQHLLNVSSCASFQALEGAVVQRGNHLHCLTLPFSSSELCSGDFVGIKICVKSNRGMDVVPLPLHSLRGLSHLAELSKRRRQEVQPEKKRRRGERQFQK